MNQIIKYIVQINTLNYNSQCIYTKKKLLSHDTYDVSEFLRVCLFDMYYLLI